MKRLALTWVLLGCCGSLFAAGEPENTVVVVNADSWASRLLANEYAHVRGIPPSHVIDLPGLPSFERLSVDEFRRLILTPVLRVIQERGLIGQIDQVLYSADFPTSIDVSADVGSQRILPVLTRMASINGLTFLHRPVLARDVRYLDLDANHYARRLVVASRDTAWSDAERQQYAEALARLRKVALQRAAQRSKGKPPGENKDRPEIKPQLLDPQALARELGPVVAVLKELRRKHPQSSELLYHLASAQAGLDRADEAIETLRAAVQAGWSSGGQALRDGNLRGLRERADFKQLMAQMREAKFEVQPAVRFSAAATWQADGRGGPSQGEHYLLSTVLACTSGRGNSVREALAGLRRSSAADGSRPRGTIYYLENKDIRSTTRAWAFRRAAEKLGEVGVQAVVEPGVLPQKKADVAGAMIGIADFQWAASGSTILPGAICEHLTSFGGMLQERDGQTPLTEFLRHGAAGASGTVTEPFAIQAKFPTPFIHYFYAQGASLAEAFYLSVAGPYQLLIVGDGLCRPWARQVELSVDGLAAEAKLRGTVVITPKLVPGGACQPTGYDLYLDGQRILSGKPGAGLRWDTTQVLDGPHLLSLVGLFGETVGWRAAARLPVVVHNGAAELTVIATVPPELRWDRPLELSARLSSAGEIVWQHHGGEVARIAGMEGRVQIDPRRLGQGHSVIQPVGKLASGGTVRGRPVVVNVVPPPPLPAVTLPAGKRLAKGFQAGPTSRPPQVVQRAEGDWLVKAGVAKDTAFAVDAWFEVPEEDVYQFQVRGDARSLVIDGVRQDWPRGSPWWFVPVSLARGLHQLHLEGVAGAAPALDIRFGGRGTQQLDAGRFQHLE